LLGVANAALAQNSNGGVFLVGGSNSTNSYLQTIYSLLNAASSSWTLMSQKLTTGRNSHVAFFATVTC
jgi:hypothetical protein